MVCLLGIFFLYVGRAKPVWYRLHVSGVSRVEFHLCMCCVADVSLPHLSLTAYRVYRYMYRYTETFFLPNALQSVRIWVEDHILRRAQPAVKPVRMHIPVCTNNSSKNNVLHHVGKRLLYLCYKSPHLYLRPFQIPCPLRLWYREPLRDDFPLAFLRPWFLILKVGDEWNRKACKDHGLQELF